MLMILYTQQQLIVVHAIKNGQNIIQSSAHGTGKSMIFVNHANQPFDMYYSIGRDDYNLMHLARQYQHEDPNITMRQRLFLDNVLINDINQFKWNYDNLASRLRNIHIIAYFKCTHNLIRYFPNATGLTTYFGPASQLHLPNKVKGDYSCLSDHITAYVNKNKPVIYANAATHILNTNDKIVDNTTSYNYALEGRFPKQAYHGQFPLLCYSPSLIIRVNSFHEQIDERMLKANIQLTILRREQPITAPIFNIPLPPTCQPTETNPYKTPQ